MNTMTAGRRKKKIRRVSRARIFDGHPLKLGGYAVFIMGLAYGAIIIAITLLYAFFYNVQYFLVFWTMLPGVLLGCALLVLERLLRQLKNFMLPGMGKMLTAFLLFFVHLIGYLALSSLVVNYPAGFFIEKAGGIAAEYSMFSVNFFIVLALVSWLLNARSGPDPCF